MLHLLKHLQNIVYGHFLHLPNPAALSAVLRAIQQITTLKCIRLRSMRLTDTVTLKMMPLLQTVMLDRICHANYILPALQECTNLTFLDISIFDEMEDCELLAKVLPSIVCLKCIQIRGGVMSPNYDNTGDVMVVNAIQNIRQLKQIKLKEIDLRDNATLLVTEHMTQLETVAMNCVHMSARRWAEFVSGLLSVQHIVKVELHYTNIDVDSLKTIDTSLDYTVIEKREYYIAFNTNHESVSS